MPEHGPSAQPSRGKSQTQGSDQQERPDATGSAVPAWPAGEDELWPDLDDDEVPAAPKSADHAPLRDETHVEDTPETPAGTTTRPSETAKNFAWPTADSVAVGESPAVDEAAWPVEELEPEVAELGFPVEEPDAAGEEQAASDEPEVGDSAEEPTETDAAPEPDVPVGDVPEPAELPAADAPAPDAEDVPETAAPEEPAEVDAPVAQDLPETADAEDSADPQAAEADAQVDESVEPESEPAQVDGVSEVAEVGAQAEPAGIVVEPQEEPEDQAAEEPAESADDAPSADEEVEDPVLEQVTDEPSPAPTTRLPVPESKTVPTRRPSVPPPAVPPPPVVGTPLPRPTTPKRPPRQPAPPQVTSSPAEKTQFIALPPPPARPIQPPRQSVRPATPDLTRDPLPEDAEELATRDSPAESTTYLAPARPVDDGTDSEQAETDHAEEHPDLPEQDTAYAPIWRTEERPDAQPEPDPGDELPAADLAERDRRTDEGPDPARPDPAEHAAGRTEPDSHGDDHRLGTQAEPDGRADEPADDRPAAAQAESDWRTDEHPDSTQPEQDRHTERAVTAQAESDWRADERPDPSQPEPDERAAAAPLARDWQADEAPPAAAQTESGWRADERPAPTQPELERPAPTQPELERRAESAATAEPDWRADDRPAAAQAESDWRTDERPAAADPSAQDTVYTPIWRVDQRPEAGDHGTTRPTEDRSADPTWSNRTEPATDQRRPGPVWRPGTGQDAPDPTWQATERASFEAGTTYLHRSQLPTDPARGYNPPTPTDRPVRPNQRPPFPPPGRGEHRTPQPYDPTRRVGPPLGQRPPEAPPRPPVFSRTGPDSQRREPVNPADVDSTRDAPGFTLATDRDEPQEHSEPKPRKRKGLLIGGAVAVVLALAAGAVVAVPGLAAKIGLASSGSDIDIAPPAPPVEFTPTLRGPGSDAPAPSAAGVQAALAGPAADPVLGTLTGTVIDPISGEVLFARNAATPLVPASTAKVLTSAAALLALPHAEQLTTRVVAGDKPGSVIIVGGGDATLSSLAPGKNSVYPGAAHLDDLVAQVKAAGPVDTVYVDLGRYNGAFLEPSWDVRDVAAGYISPIVPAMLDGGRTDPTKATTPRSDNPARALAEAFAKRIGATVPAKAQATAPTGAKILGEVKSAPVVELVDTVLQRSDNVLAEILAREVARATNQETSFAGGTKAIVETLRSNGFDVTGLKLSDGSGLSTQNQVAAALLAEVLKVAAAPEGADPRTAKLRPLLGGLPVAGGSGTLATRYQGPNASPGKGWVRAKTGTLSSVNSLAGVVLDKDGRLLVFALMTNGSDPGQAQPALDVLAATLRQCGCR